MPGRHSHYLRNVVKEGRLKPEDALLAHRQLSTQLFEASQKASMERFKSDMASALMAGEMVLHASGPVYSDAISLRPAPKTKPQEIPRHPEDHVIRFTCELVMVGSVQSCQHGILCKERK